MPSLVRNRTPTTVKRSRSKSRTRTPVSKSRTPSPVQSKGSKDKKVVDEDFKEILNTVEVKLTALSRKSSESFQNLNESGFSSLHSMYVFTLISIVDAVALFIHYFILASIWILYLWLLRLRARCVSSFH